MGGRMMADDIFVGTFLDMLNLRFAPSMKEEEEWVTGIAELAALQKEFDIFRAGRRFSQSVALLSTGGVYNPRAKARWFKYLDDLWKMQSSEPGVDGDACIVRALLANFAADPVLPVHFTSHPAEGEDEKQWRVIITAGDRPLHYMAQDYVTVSLPMRPRPGRSGGAASPGTPEQPPPPAPKKKAGERKAAKKKKDK